MESSLESVLKEVEKELTEDVSFTQYFEKEKLKEIIKTHHQNLINFINGSQIDTEFYQRLNIPFSFFKTDYSLIKEKIISLEEKITTDTIKKFSDFKSLIAKIFIKKEISDLETIITTPYEDLLFSYHFDFVKKIIKSIQEDNLSIYPYEKPENCKFDEILNYPKSKMVIYKDQYLKEIKNLHYLIHKSSNVFYLNYKNQKFTQAYFLLQNLKEVLFKFVKLLRDLYFETLMNLEERFFNLALNLHSKQDIKITIIDIKNLKNFNLIYGERIVNEAIKTINAKIESFMKEDYKHTLSIKGDTADFFILNTNYSIEEYENFLKKVHKELTKPITIENTTLSIPIILGGINLKKEFFIDKDSILNSLTILKNKAKEENVEIKIVKTKEDFDSILNERFKSSFIISKLDNKEIDLVFQPIFETKSNELFSLEVLGRIKEKDSLLPIGIFIDKIYDLQLIEKFDLLILEKLIEKEKQIKEITNKIFLNISFQSLLNNDYMKKLKEFLDSFKIEVIIELTEQKLISDVNLIKEIYDKYKIKFAVDDFGTGYSSLQLVMELVERGILRILKIDGSLIKNLEKNENMKKMIKLIANLGKDFNLITVAEFVENKDILNFLKKIEIDLVQGFYLSKPKTIEELLKEKEKFIQQQRKNRIYNLVYGKI